MALDPTRAMPALLLVLAACVSGSSDEGGPIRVTFSPAALTKSFDQGDELTTGIPFAMTLSRATDGPSFPRIQPLEPTFLPEVLVVTQNADGTMRMLSLEPFCGLAPGTYSGVVTVDLCRDPACTATYALSGNTIPFAVTVSPGFLLTAAVDGVPEPGFKTLCGAGGLGAGALWDLGLTAGQTVVLTSTVPVTWSASLGEVGCGLTLNAVSSTATSWTATIGSTSPGYGCGNVYVDAALSPADWIHVVMRVGL